MKDSGKLEKLKNILRKLKHVVVAYSGGVDSTFLLKMAVETIGRENVLAVTAKSETYPKKEFDSAVRFLRKENLCFRIIRTKEFNNKYFRSNPVNRCYYCKKELFGKLEKIRRSLRYNAVIDGTNYDDRLDIRHGTKAKDEYGVVSPLAEARITKQVIREYSKIMKLPTYSKPSLACLASRIPYNTEITLKLLKRIDRAECYIRAKGFSQVRVRDYGDVARIELDRKEIKRLFNGAKHKGIVKYLKSLGYKHVTVDLEGYRTGSMNLQEAK